MEAVRYRDRLFAVLSVNTDDGRVSVSGQIPTACPSMPLVAECEQRGGGPDAVYGEQWRVANQRDPGVTWRRSAAVYEWLAGGALGLGPLADLLARQFGPGLAAAMCGADSTLREALEGTYSEDEADAIMRRVERHALVAEAAAALGECGAAWLARTVTERLDTAGPLRWRENPAPLVAAGVIDPASLVQTQVHFDVVDVAGAAVDWACAVHGAHGLSRSALDGPFGPLAVDGDVSRLVADALGAGALYRHGRRYVGPAMAHRAAALAADLPRPPQAANWPTGVYIAPGVNVIAVDIGASLAFLTRDLAVLRQHGMSVRVVAPDERGALYPTNDTPAVDLGTTLAAADVVVLLDAHRYSYRMLATTFADATSATCTVLVGDTRLWAPGLGDRTVADLAAHPDTRVIRRSGSGVGVALAAPDVNVFDLPTVHRSDPAGPCLRVWRRGPTALSPKPGRTAVLVQPHRGFEPGAVGTVAGVERRQHAVIVEFPPCASVAIPTYKLAGDVSAGWLPGVRTDRLWVTTPLPSDAWYAVVAAATEIYVSPRVHAPQIERRTHTSLLADMLARR